MAYQADIRLYIPLCQAAVKESEVHVCSADTTGCWQHIPGGLYREQQQRAHVLGVCAL